MSFDIYNAPVTSELGLSAFVTGLVAGQQYTALASMRTVNTRSCSIEITWYDSSGVSTGTRAFSGLTSIGSTGWTQISVTGTAPANTTKARIVIRENAPTSAADILYIDQASLAPGSSTTYQPPGTVAITVNGTVINSTSNNNDMRLTTTGAGAVRVNADPSSGTGGVILGAGAGAVLSVLTSLISMAKPLVYSKASQTLAANGAVTIDASSGDLQDITLNANATSSTIINPQTNQMLSIAWIQDATGGRTYVWPTNCKFAGGAAPSDTTASKRTTVRFVYDGTNWNEIARSVAVG